LGSSIKKLFGSIGKGKSAADDTPEIDMGEFHLEDARSILSEALYELYTVLSSITGSIYEFFRGLSGELSFYDTGLKYCRFLSSPGSYVPSAYAFTGREYVQGQRPLRHAAYTGRPDKRGNRLQRYPD
jgi:hypothetical protein